MTLDAPAWALAFLRDARVGRLATADREGRPLVVPVCFVFDGVRICSAIDAKPKRTRELRRLRNIDENPHVSLVVDHYDEQWEALRWVIVEGRATLLRTVADVEAAVELLRAKYPQYRAMQLDGTASVIAIEPDRVLTWRFAGA